MKASSLSSLFPFSEKRREVLFLLQEGPKTLDEIKDHLKASSSETIHYMRKLEEKNLIHKKEERYTLTDVGGVVAANLSTFFKTLNLFEENEKFWKEHDISGIPEEFRLRLYDLRNYKIFESTPTEVFKPHDTYVQNLLKSKSIKGVSPVLHPEYPKTVVMLAEKGVDISLILTKNIFEKIKKEHKKELEKYLSFKNASLKVCNEEIKVAFTVSDVFLSMRLFLYDGTYDFYRNVITHEKSALKWGEELFRYFEKCSAKVG